MKRAEKVFNKLLELCIEQYKQSGKLTGITTNEIADILNIHRANVSGDLNKLCKNGRAEKVR